MLTADEAAQARAMSERGRTISVIARHLGRDRRTIRDHLNGTREPGIRRPRPDPLTDFLGYCRQRFTDDPHLAATTLFHEVIALGYQGRYSTFTRALRRHELRPDCETCAKAAAKATTSKIDAA
jgi:predicted transcriptional regulator